MKKVAALLAGLIAVCALPLSGQAETTPKAQYGTPKIDGVIDSIWAKSDQMKVTMAADEGGHQRMASEEALGKSYARVMWDDKNLYVLVVGDTDTTKSKPAAVPPKDDYMSEVVSLFVSETADDLGSYYGDDLASYQCFVSPYAGIGSKKDGLSIWINNPKFSGKLRTVQYGCVRNASDYVVEVSIPWKNTGRQTGDLIGFNFTLNDDNNRDNYREYYVSYANPAIQRYWETPDLPLVELTGKTVQKGTTTKAGITDKAPATTKSKNTTTTTQDTKATKEESEMSDTSVFADPTTDASQQEGETSISQTTATAATKKTQGSLSGGAIAGIVLGLVVLLGGAAAAVLLIRKKKNVR